ncbi:MAG: radical SAM protein, partial [Bdellovibrionia bacterium]
MSRAVALIRGAGIFPKFRPSGITSAIPPLGLAYVAGSVRAAGYDVTCIDASGESLGSVRTCTFDNRFFESGLTIEEITERIPKNISVIGVSCMFSLEWFYVLELVREIRAKFPRAFIVLGGEHVTADYEYILRTTSEADACVLGEGENKFVSMLQALDEGVEKERLPGCAVRDSVTSVPVKNPEADGRYRIQSVDEIPRPAWDLFPIESYQSSKHSIGSRHHRAMPMLASRGCPYRCSFCSSPQMWTTRWKARAVGDLINEIKSYIRDYGINRIEFYDLSMFIDKRWIAEFCNRVIDEKLDITWTMTSGARTEALSPDILELIKKSGCIV